MKSVALVGAGRWGSNYIRVLHELGALHTVCDADPKVIANIVTDFADVHVTPDMEDVLLNPEIRGVVIATPTETHAELALQALRAGKDVLAEKPLCCSEEVCRALIGAATQSQRILMTGHILRYHPAAVRLIEIARSGELGEIQRMACVRWNTGESGEDPFWDLVPHDLSLVLAVMGAEPQELPHVQRSKGVSADMRLRFRGGAQVSISTKTGAVCRVRTIVVTGSLGTVVLEDGRHPTLSMLSPSGVRELPFADSEPLMMQCRHFLQCMNDRSCPLTDGEEALRVIRILEACDVAPKSLLVHAVA